MVKSKTGEMGRENRRAYLTPKVVDYGDVRKLTQGGTKSSSEDTMAMSTNKL